MGFKENLRRLREQAGLTQTQMAAKAGVPFRSYQNWETGSREPRIAALSTLAEALGVSVDMLIAASAGSDKRTGPRKQPATAEKHRKGK
jgi:transcriptional regulator with XRE-family HTH domain